MKKKSDIVRDTVPNSIFEMAQRRMLPLLKEYAKMPKTTIVEIMAVGYLQGVRDVTLLIEEQKENIAYEI